jgi:hypothetical protein
MPRGSQAPYFNSSSFEGVPFRVRASGTITATADGSQSALISLCLGSSGTIGSNVIIGTTGAALVGVAGGTYTWFIAADCIWSIGVAANGNLASQHSAVISFLPTPTRQVVSNVIQTNATAAAAAASNLVFTVFCTLGYNNAASGTFTPQEFAIETI